MKIITEYGYLGFVYLICSIDVRTDVLQNGLSTNSNPRLNVHAKEFTMKQGDLSTSRYAKYVFITCMVFNPNKFEDIIFRKPPERIS
jgi:hypothetical protein